MAIARFRVDEADADTFRGELERVHGLLAAQRGYVGGHLGRNVDDPALWALVTVWEGPGAYRRALSAYDVKVGAWDLLGRSIDEPGAYEVVEPGSSLLGSAS